MCDARLSSWDTKYTYNFVRPVTAIRNAAADGNPDTDGRPGLDAAAGHAAPPVVHLRGTARSAPRPPRCWRGFFGDDSIAFSDTSEVPASAGAPVTRSFAGFREAAEEAGASRIYGGIHWQFDNQAGLTAGRKVGEFVSKHLLRPLGGGHRDGNEHGSPFCDRESNGRGGVIRSLMTETNGTLTATAARCSQADDGVTITQSQRQTGQTRRPRLSLARPSPLLMLPRHPRSRTRRGRRSPVYSRYPLRSTPGLGTP